MWHKTRLLPLLLWIALCALPFFLLLRAIAEYGVNVPFKDELYALTPLMEKVLLTGQWSLSDFYGQLNDHRPVVPVLLLTFLAWFTGWNAHAELFLAPILTMLNVLLIYRLSLTTLPRLKGHTRGLLMFVTCVLVFSLTQWENWSQGINIAFLLPITFLLAGAFILSSRERTRRSTAIAAGFCLLASFSHAEGLLTWLALLPLVPRKNLPLWGSAASTTFLIYFYDFSSPPRSLDGMAHALANPFPTLLYSLRVLGSAFFPVAHPLSLPAGITLAALFLTIRVSKHKSGARRSADRGWMCVLLYAVLFALLFALGRGTLSHAYRAEVSSKIVAVSALVPIAILHLAFLRSSVSPKHTLALFAFSLFVVATNIYGTLSSLKLWEERSSDLREGKACLIDYETADELCLKKLGFDTDERLPPIRDLGRVLDALRTNRG